MPQIRIADFSPLNDIIRAPTQNTPVTLIPTFDIKEIVQYTLSSLMKFMKHIQKHHYSRNKEQLKVELLQHLEQKETFLTEKLQI